MTCIFTYIFDIIQSKLVGYYFNGKRLILCTMSHDNNSTYIYVSQQRAISQICSRSENDVEK